MKALKPTDAELGQFGHVGELPGTRPPQSPKSVMDAASSARVWLRIRGRSTVHGDGVERHVEEQRAAARRQRAAAGGGAFPIGAAGLVEMDVNVDQARENMLSRVASISSFPPGKSGPIAEMMPSSIARSAWITPPA